MDFGAKIKYRGYRGKEWEGSQGGDKLRGRKRILLDHPMGDNLFWVNSLFLPFQPVN